MVLGFDMMGLVDRDGGVNNFGLDGLFLNAAYISQLIWWGLGEKKLTQGQRFHGRGDERARRQQLVELLGCALFRV